MMLSKKFSFWFILIFWVSVNLLLWRLEFGNTFFASEVISPDQFLFKVLTSPDYSMMVIKHHGTNVGEFNWMCDIVDAQNNLNRKLRDIEGRIDTISSYSIRVELNLNHIEPLRNLKLGVDLNLSTNYVVNEFSAKLNLKPFSWRVSYNSAEGIFKITDLSLEKPKEFSISNNDINNPRKILETLGITPDIAAIFLPADLGMKINSFKRKLEYDCSLARIKIGNTYINGFKCQIKLSENSSIRIYINKVGEIIKIELPNYIVLLNRAFLY